MSHMKSESGTDDPLQAGLAASRRNDVEAALAFFAEACAALPTDPMPQFLLGSELASAGQMDRAEAALANAVLLAPGFQVARYQLGLLQFSSGRPATALVTWAPLIAQDPDNALSHFVRGFAALAQDDLRGARASFEAGLSRPIENAAIAADIEKVLARIAQVSGGERVRPEAEQQEADGLHVLISNYGKTGTLH